MVDDPQRRCPNISLARDVLGWEPKIAADDGLRRTAAWFRRAPLR
jgi:dTDP-glucose 4,6-dehydratase